MAAVFTPNKRRVRFDLTLRILDLNNVPLVSGTSLVKWHLPSSTAAEHRGRTAKASIREHRVEYGYERKVAVRLTVGKAGTLQECCVAFEILQEYSAAGRGERIRLGEVKLNLAEYVEPSELQPAAAGGVGGGGGGEQGVVRRYLMQDSKINSTLKVGIYMRYVDGTRDWVAPPLRSAPVFGGIAGIMSAEQPVSAAHSAAAQDYDATSDAAIVASAMPNLSRANRENGEMQDMYRRTLAAYLFSAPGELKADDAIEDIFAGGDGWGRSGRPNVNAQQHSPKTADGNGSNASTAAATHERGTAQDGGRGFRGGGRHRHDGKRKIMPKGRGELDEFEVREDFRSWNVGEAAMS